MGLGLIAATVGIIAFVRYRSHESARLSVDLGLSAQLRAAAGADAVRLAAVDEFETDVYRRLFYVSVVAPRVRSAAWSLLGLLLAVAAALAVSPLGGGLATAAYILAGVFAVGFAIATLTHAGLAVYHTVATPRVSFDEVDPDEPVADGPVVEGGDEAAVDVAKPSGAGDSAATDPAS